MHECCQGNFYVSKSLTEILINLCAYTQQRNGIPFQIVKLRRIYAAQIKKFSSFFLLLCIRVRFEVVYCGGEESDQAYCMIAYTVQQIHAFIRSGRNIEKKLTLFLRLTLKAINELNQITCCIFIFVLLWMRYMHPRQCVRLCLGNTPPALCIILSLSLILSTVILRNSIRFHAFSHALFYSLSLCSNSNARRIRRVSFSSSHLFFHSLFLFQLTFNVV